MAIDVGSYTGVHENVRSLRDKHGLTQEQVADYLGLSVNGYGDIERGATDIKLSRLIQISKLFDVSVADLVSPKLKLPEITGTLNNANVKLLRMPKCIK